MGAEVVLDTSAAHRQLDALLDKINRMNSVRTVGSSDDGLDPAKVAQAQKRYERRNGPT